MIPLPGPTQLFHLFRSRAGSVSSNGHHLAALEPRHAPLRRGGSLDMHSHETLPAHIQWIWPGLQLADATKPPGTQLYLIPLNSLWHRQIPLQLLQDGQLASGKFNKALGQVLVFRRWDCGDLELTQERSKISE